VKDVIKAKEAGMDDHIAKPINPQMLYMVLARYIRK